MKAVAGFIISKIEKNPVTPTWATITSENGWSIPVPISCAKELRIGMSLDVDLTINSEHEPKP